MDWNGKSHPRRPNLEIPASPHPLTRPPTKGLLCIPRRLQPHCPTRLETLFSQNPPSFPQPLFLSLWEAWETRTPHRPVLTPISKTPQFHSLDLENSHIQSTSSLSSTSALFPLFLPERRVLLSFSLFFSFFLYPSHLPSPRLQNHPCIFARSSNLSPSSKPTRHPGIQRSTPVFHAHRAQR